MVEPIAPPTRSKDWNTMLDIAVFPFKLRSPLICRKEEKFKVTEAAAKVTVPPTDSKRGQRISLIALLVIFKSPPTRTKRFNVTPHKLSAEFIWNFPPTSSRLSKPVNSYPINNWLIVISLVTRFKVDNASKERMVSLPVCRPIIKLPSIRVNPFAPKASTSSWVFNITIPSKVNAFFSGTYRYLLSAPL